MSTTPEELLRRANRGDADALRELLRVVGPQVRATIASQIGSPFQALVDADDVMQVTYLEAFLDRERLAAENEAVFVGWLRRIAENNLRDAIRELQRKKRPNPAHRVQSPDAGQSYVQLVDYLGITTTTPSRDAAKSEVRHLIDKVVEQLPGDYATVIRMYDLQCKPIGDVAAAMNRSTGAVHMLRARAHDRLRELLGRETDFFTQA